MRIEQSKTFEIDNKWNHSVTITLECDVWNNDEAEIGFSTVEETGRGLIEVETRGLVDGKRFWNVDELKEALEGVGFAHDLTVDKVIEDTLTEPDTWEILD